GSHWGSSDVGSAGDGQRGLHAAVTHGPGEGSLEVDDGVAARASEGNYASVLVGGNGCAVVLILHVIEQLGGHSAVGTGRIVVHGKGGGGAAQIEAAVGLHGEGGAGLGEEDIIRASGNGRAVLQLNRDIGSGRIGESRSLQHETVVAGGNDDILSGH